MAVGHESASVLMYGRRLGTTSGCETGCGWDCADTGAALRSVRAFARRAIWQTRPGTAGDVASAAGGTRKIQGAMVRRARKWYSLIGRPDLLNMPRAFAQLVAVLLLITQAAASWGPGRVLCLPVSGAEDYSVAHEDHTDDCDHHRALASTKVEGSCGGHDHGTVVAVLHARSDCGCHVHVPVRSDDTAPITPRDRAADARAALAQIVVAWVVAWKAGPAPLVVPGVNPPDRTRGAHVRALKSTRLRV